MSGEEYIFNSEDFQNRLVPEDIYKYRDCVNHAKNVINELLAENIDDNLSPIEQIKYDLFVSYCLCSLFWIYLRNNGKCPIKNGIKKELDKIKEYNDRLKILEDSKNRPIIDKKATKRIIQHELWENNLPNKRIKVDQNETED